MNARLRLALTGVSCMLCLAGAMTLGRGVAVPVQAQIAQARLEHSFARRLKAAAAEPPAPVRGEDRKVARLPAHGAIARLSVTRLGVREIVLAGDGSDEQLARAPTMIRRQDGDAPVTILAAHRDTHFLFIRDLQAGDEVDMQWVDGSRERYRITRLETVRWDSFAYPRDPARPLLALATCFPFDVSEHGGPWRRVAWGERVG